MFSPDLVPQDPLTGFDETLMYIKAGLFTCNELNIEEAEHVVIPHVHIGAACTTKAVSEYQLTGESRILPNT